MPLFAPLYMPNLPSQGIKKNELIKFIFTWIVLFLTILFFWSLLILYTHKPCTFVIFFSSFFIAYIFKGNTGFIAVALAASLLSLVAYILAMTFYCFAFPLSSKQPCVFYAQEHFTSLEYFLLMMGAYVAFKIKK